MAMATRILMQCCTQHIGNSSRDGRVVTQYRLHRTQAQCGSGAAQNLIDHHAHSSITAIIDMILQSTTILSKYKTEESDIFESPSLLTWSP